MITEERRRSSSGAGLKKWRNVQVPADAAHCEAHIIYAIEGVDTSKEYIL
jgi:hypothetical protein